MICNLYGDHVKGSNFNHYPEKIKQGIRLHRSIDFYIDNHPSSLCLKQLLYAELPKVAGIAVDLYFDHLLAKNWQKFHPQRLTEYLINFFNHSSLYEFHMKEHFREFLSQLRRYRWIEHYPSDEGLQKLCEGVSRKISFENSLIQAPQLFRKYEEQVNEAFYTFMNDARNNFNV